MHLSTEELPFALDDVRVPGPAPVPDLAQLNPAPQVANPIPDPGRIWVADYRDSTLVAGGLPYKPVDLVGMIRLAEGGDTRRLYAFYDEMRARDAHLDCELSKAEDYLTSARMNVLPFPRRIRTTSGHAGTREGRKAGDIAVYCEEQLNNPTVQLDRAIHTLANGLWKGAAGLQVLVKPGFGGKETLVGLEAIPSQRFRYLPASTTLVLQQNANYNSWVPVAELGDSIAVLVADSNVPNPSRRGLLRRAMGLWMMRLYGPSWWSRFVELFGQPYRVGHFPSGDTQSEQRIITALERMGSASWAALPEGARVEFVQLVTRGNSGPPHELMMEWAAREMSKVILGATQTADVQRNTGSRASAQVHHDVTIARSFARGVRISAVLREQVLKPLVRRNFGNDAAELYTPELKLRVENQPDIYNLAQAIKMFADAGIKTIPVSWVHDQAGIPVAADGEPCVVPPIMPGTPMPPKKGEVTGPQGTPPAKPEMNPAPKPAPKEAA